MDELGTTAHSFDREIRVVCQTTTREALSRVTYNGLDKLKVYFQNKENNEILNLLKTFTVDTINLKMHRTYQKNRSKQVLDKVLCMLANLDLVQRRFCLV